MLLGVLGDMIASWFEKIIEFISGFFAFIPMTIYFIYTSCCSLLDLFQYLIRKLAGLDVYYVNGEAQEGDMLVSFIRGILGIDGGSQYSTLSTVFWSLIIFSVILLVLTTIISIIKAHYNYDSKKSQPMTIVTTSIKALFTMVVVPIVTVFGLALSNIVLQTLDTLTSTSSGSNIAALFGNDVNKLENFGQIKKDENDKPILDDNGNEVLAGTPIYASYDAFGFGGATTSTTFSGAVFKLAAYDCNRVRTGSFSAKTSSNNAWSDYGIFVEASGDRGRLAEKIDEAFASRLTLKSEYAGTANTWGADSWILNSAYLAGGGAAFGTGLIYVKSFSKYNVGLVYYYYNLWTFNYFIAFAAMAAMFTLMINIIFGLIARLIECLALFLVYSPTLGILPLDGGNAFKKWKQEFISRILMAYGSVIGMNVFFLILPFFYSISFFNNFFLDRIMNILFIIAGLSLVKKFMKMLSSFIGATDANEYGKAVVDDVKATGMKAANMTMKAATVGVGIGKMGTKVGGAIFSKSLNFAKSENKAKTKTGRFFERTGKIIAGGAGMLVGGGAGATSTIFKGVSDGKVRKRVGLEKGAEVTEENRKQYAQMKTLKKLGNVDKKEIEQAYASGDQAKIQAVIDKNNQVAKERLGDSVDEDTLNKMTGDGGIIQSQAPKDPSKMQAFGKGMLDLGGATLKLAGDMTGLTTLFGDMKKANIFDSAKEGIQSFAQGIGAINKNKDGKYDIPKWMQTGKQGEDSDKKAAEAQRDAARETKENTQKTLDAIKTLSQALEQMKKKK